MLLLFWCEVDVRWRGEGVRRDDGCTKDEQWGPHGFVANELVWSLSGEAICGSAYARMEWLGPTFNLDPCGCSAQ